MIPDCKLPGVLWTSDMRVLLKIQSNGRTSTFYIICDFDDKELYFIC